MEKEIKITPRTEEAINIVKDFDRLTERILKLCEQIHGSNENWTLGREIDDDCYNLRSQLIQAAADSVSENLRVGLCDDSTRQQETLKSSKRVADAQIILACFEEQKKRLEKFNSTNRKTFKNMDCDWLLDDVMSDFESARKGWGICATEAILSAINDEIGED